MRVLKAVWDTPYLFWLVLAAPSFAVVRDAASGQPLWDLLAPTGLYAAELMIAALALTPLRMIWPKAGWLIWLRRRRRYLGVAAFGYGALHAAFYMIHMGGAAAIGADLARFGACAGWLAFIILTPIAITSNDRSARRHGPSWGKAQRFVYLAALAVLVHWIFGPQDIVAALAHFAPLALLEVYRIWRQRRRGREVAAIAAVALRLRSRQGPRLGPADASTLTDLTAASPAMAPPPDRQEQATRSAG